jgi:two-component system, cell cycle sensor histidine kinase and response regulator CckA
VNQPETTSTELAQPIPLTVDGTKPRNLPVVLLVEDEALVREVVADILEYEGYRVLKARNAVEAQAAFGGCGETVGLLIADVVLPGQNGLELARTLRAACPTLRTILISGFPENAVTRQGRMEGGSVYLSKPFSAESLVGTVKQVLIFEAEEVTT